MVIIRGGITIIHLGGYKLISIDLCKCKRKAKILILYDSTREKYIALG